MIDHVFQPFSNVYSLSLPLSRLPNQQVDVFRNLQSCPKDQSKRIVNNYRDIQTSHTEPKITFARNVAKSKL